MCIFWMSWWKKCGPLLRTSFVLEVARSNCRRRAHRVRRNMLNLAALLWRCKDGVDWNISTHSHLSLLLALLWNTGTFHQERLRTRQISILRVKRYELTKLSCSLCSSSIGRRAGYARSPCRFALFSLPRCLTPLSAHTKLTDSLW